MDLTAGYLVASLVTSCVGFSLYLYGKKQARVPQLATGCVLMVFPYFVHDALWVCAIAFATVAGLFIAVRRGA